MTEDEWLRSVDPVRMVKFLQGRVSDRKLQLFACAHCLRSKRAENSKFGMAYRMAQEFADNPADRSLIADWVSPNGFAYPEHAYDWAFAGVTTDFDKVNPEEIALDYVDPETITALIRHIIGNPFRPSPPLLCVPATIRELAESAYQQNRTVVGPLRDALLDAGLAELAAHFASPEDEHPKGCWALDALTGRS